MYGTIYLRFCRTTNKSYIGQTTRTVQERWRDRYTGCPLFGRVLKKYGMAGFDTAILARAENQDELDQLEATFIKVYNTIHPNGYNLRDGGFGNGKHHPETLQKISKIFAGKHQSPEHIAKRVTKHLGAHRSAEARKNMSEAKKIMGYKPSQTAIDAARKAVVGTFRSEETKEKMRQSKLGIPRSQETKDKVSAGLKKYYAQKLIDRFANPTNPDTRGRLFPQFHHEGD